MTAPTQTDIERHVQQTNDRLYCIRQHLQASNTFQMAARELLEWCSDARAFHSSFEEQLISCLSTVNEVSCQPGYDLDLGYRLLAVCAQHKDRLSHDSSVLLGNWCEELGRLVLLKHQRNSQAEGSQLATDMISSSQPPVSSSPNTEPAPSLSSGLSEKLSAAPLPTSQQSDHNTHVPFESVPPPNGSQQSSAPLSTQTQQQQQVSIVTTIWAGTPTTQTYGGYGQPPSYANMAKPGSTYDYGPHKPGYEPRPTPVPSELAMVAAAASATATATATAAMALQHEVPHQPQPPPEAMYDQMGMRHMPHYGPQRMKMGYMQQRRVPPYHMPPRSHMMYPQGSSAGMYYGASPGPGRVPPNQSQYMGGGPAQYGPMSPSNGPFGSPYRQQSMGYMQPAPPMDAYGLPPGASNGTLTPPMTPGMYSPGYNNQSCPVPPHMMDVKVPVSLKKDDELRLTFPVTDGYLLAPFRLEHGLVVSNHCFVIRDNIFQQLLQRSDLELQLKCFHHEDRNMQTNWPQNLSVSVNSQPVLVERGDSLRAHKPMHIKLLCQAGRNTLQITAPQCCCSHLFVLQLVHRPSIRAAREGLLKKRLLQAEHCVTKIKRQFMNIPNPSSHGALASNPEDGSSAQCEQAFTVTLKCPISHMRIRLPARGQDCKHTQCFDLESYLQFQCERDWWKCPLCGLPAALETLEIDQYFWGILTNLHDRPDVDEVTISPDACWRPLLKSTSSAASQQPPDSGAGGWRPKPAGIPTNIGPASHIKQEDGLPPPPHPGPPPAYPGTPISISGTMSQQQQQQGRPISSTAIAPSGVPPDGNPVGSNAGSMPPTLSHLESLDNTAFSPAPSNIANSGCQPLSMPSTDQTGRSGNAMLELCNLAERFNATVSSSGAQGPNTGVKLNKRGTVHEDISPPDRSPPRPIDGPIGSANTEPLSLEDSLDDDFLGDGELVNESLDWLDSIELPAQTTSSASDSATDDLLSLLDP